jgi:NADH dehydrogenase
MKSSHANGPVAQGAIQAGDWAGRALLARLNGMIPKPFRYTDKGDVAVIGRFHGVTNIPWLGPLGRQGGFIAWAMWLAIHLFYLIGLTNRAVVMLRWGWNFFTSGRGTRLITGSPLLPPIEEPAPPAWSGATAPAEDAAEDGSTAT